MQRELEEKKAKLAQVEQSLQQSTVSSTPAPVPAPIPTPVSFFAVVYFYSVGIL